MTRMSYFLILGTLISGCTINEPSLPKWDTSWEVHLKGDVIKISDLLENNSSLKDSLDSDTNEQTYFINISDTSAAQQINATDLSAKTEDQTFINKLGVFKVSQPAPQVSQGNSFSDIFSESNPQAGMPFPIIEPRLITPDPTETTFEEFKEIEIESATISVIFYNNLILGINGGMEIILKDLERISEPGGGLIDTIKFADPIPANTFLESNTIDLAGKNISNKLQLIYRIPLSGTDSVMILDEDDLNSNFFTEVVMSPVRVNRALAKIPGQSIIHINTAPVSMDDHSIRIAKIDMGKMNLLIENKMNISSDIEIELPNFTDKNNRPLVTTKFVDAQSNENIQIDLAGYSLQNEKQNNDYVENIIYNIIAQTQSSDVHVWLDADDQVSVSMQMDTLYFESLTGYISEKEIAFDPVKKTRGIFDHENFQGSFKFPDLSMTFNFHNEIDFDISMDMTVTGYHRDPTTKVITDSVSLKMSKVVERSHEAIQCCTIILNKQSSTPSIVDLVAIIPNEIIVTGRAVIEGEGSVRNSDKMWIDYTIDSPLTLQIDEPLIYTNEKETIGENEINGETRDKISQNFSEVTFKISSVNEMPIGSVFKLFLSSDSTNLFTDEINDSTEKIILASEIIAANTNSDGFVSAPYQDEHLLSLNKKQISIFEQTPLYYGAKVIIGTTENAIRFRAADQIRYEAIMLFEVIMDPDNL